MKLRAFLFLFLSVTAFWAISEIHSYKSVFYSALASQNLAKIDAEINAIKSTSIKEKDAYIGTLTMQKAGLLSNLSSKLKTFKEGHALLEGAIEKEPNNTEYSFLRLVIQENAPAILKYNKNINEDLLKVNKGFKQLTPDVQQAIIDYSKKSKVLKESTLK
jgi:hypothetical protein